MTFPVSLMSRQRGAWPDRSAFVRIPTMALGLLGTKVGMTQVFDDKGEATPVTVLQVGPCRVLQIRTPERDGYSALQLGYLDKSRKRATKPERGHVSAEMESKRRAQGIPLAPKPNCEPQKHIREFRLDASPTQDVGAVLTVAEVFGDVKAVDVIGRTKGRGFAGVIKRHGYGGLRHTHGVKKGWRQRGSTGSHASNRGSGRPKKGIRMAGRYGNERVTVRNLAVVKIDADRNLLLVKGAVPGPNGGLVMVRPTNKR
jgi:large subunit ribosomal protein L3